MEYRSGLVFDGLIESIKNPDDLLLFGSVVNGLSVEDKVRLTDWVFITDCGRGRS